MKSDVQKLGPLIVLGLSICWFSGCAAFPMLKNEELPAEPVAAQETAPYFVEMHPSFGKPKVYKGQITEPITVQQALELSGANDTIKSMTVDLYRRLPNGTALKLPVDFKKNQQVKYEQDYALHPNDRIVVRAKSSSALDKFVDQVFGEL